MPVALRPKKCRRERSKARSCAGCKIEPNYGETPQFAGLMKLPQIKSDSIGLPLESVNGRSP